MRTIAHISDLHFGTEDAAMAAALAADLNDRSPALLVVSGDLTQRARAAQFQAARAYLGTLPKPQLVVPGNHDVPLFDVIRRFFAPLARYRRWITPELSPVVEDGDLVAIGVNTARSLTWKEGRISLEQIARLQQTLAAVSARHRIVVTHHPFIPPRGAGADRIKLVGRAARALAVLDEQRVDLLLAGHLHEGYSGVTQPYYPTARRAIVSAQAGTAISGRVRQQPNAYNLIHLDGHRMAIEIRTWQDGRFEGTATAQFERRNGSWEARV